MLCSSGVSTYLERNMLRGALRRFLRLARLFAQLGRARGRLVQPNSSPTRLCSIQTSPANRSRIILLRRPSSSPLLNLRYPKTLTD